MSTVPVALTVVVPKTCAVPPVTLSRPVAPEAPPTVAVVIVSSVPGSCTLTTADASGRPALPPITVPVALATARAAPGRPAAENNVMRTIAEAGMSDPSALKRRSVQALTLLSCLLALVNVYSFWVLASTFATSLVWWAELLHVIAPASAFLGMLLSLWRPRQTISAGINGAVLRLHALFVLAFVVG